MEIKPTDADQVEESVSSPDIPFCKAHGVSASGPCAMPLCSFTPMSMFWPLVPASRGGLIPKIAMRHGIAM